MSYQILNKDRTLYTIQFIKKEENTELVVTEKSSLSSVYKASLNIENFQQINKFFRKFNTVKEIFEYFSDLEEISENTIITLDNKFVKMNIKLPSISKSKTNDNFFIQIPKIELKENVLIVKLCQQVKKLAFLKIKLNIYFVVSEKIKKISIHLIIIWKLVKKI